MMEPAEKPQVMPFHKPAMVVGGYVGHVTAGKIHEEIEAYAERNHISLEEVNVHWISFKKDPNKVVIELTRKQGEIPIIGYPKRVIEINVEWK